MSFEAGAITGEIDISEAPTVRNFRNLERETATMKNRVQGEMDKAAKGAERTWKDSLANIKGELGKGSLLGQGLKVAMGGGAVAGLGMLAREVEQFSDSMAKMADRVRTGELTMEGLRSEVVREIPIFGSLVRTVDNIKEAYTGAEAAHSKWLAGLQKSQAAISANVARMQVLKGEMSGLKGLGDSWRDSVARELHPEIGPRLDFAARMRQQEANSKGISGFLEAAGGSGSDAAKNIQEQINENTAHLFSAKIDSKMAQDAANAAARLAFEYRKKGAGPEEVEAMSGEAAKQQEAAAATMREANFRSQIALLKQAKSEALAYADALNDSKQKLGYELSKQGISEFSKTADWFRTQAKMVENVTHFKGSKADARSPSEKLFEALPNARTQGEQIFERRTVTGADMGQAYADKTEKVVEVIEKGNTQQQASFGELISAVRTAASTLVLDPP